MKKILFVIVLIAIGCNGPAERTITPSNKNYTVDRLFEIDGVTVYRFEDGGRHHYFATTGTTFTHQPANKSSIPEQITTVKKEFRKLAPKD